MNATFIWVTILAFAFIVGNIMLIRYLTPKDSPSNNPNNSPNKNASDTPNPKKENSLEKGSNSEASEKRLT